MITLASLNPGVTRVSTGSNADSQQVYYDQYWSGGKNLDYKLEEWTYHQKFPIKYMSPRREDNVAALFRSGSELHVLPQESVSGSHA